MQYDVATLTKPLPMAPVPGAAAVVPSSAAPPTKDTQPPPPAAAAVLPSSAAPPDAQRVGVDQKRDLILQQGVSIGDRANTSQPLKLEYFASASIVESLGVDEVPPSTQVHRFLRPPNAQGNVVQGHFCHATVQLSPVARPTTGFVAELHLTEEREVGTAALTAPRYASSNGVVRLGVESTNHVAHGTDQYGVVLRETVTMWDESPTSAAAGHFIGVPTISCAPGTYEAHFVQAVQRETGLLEEPVTMTTKYLVDGVRTRRGALNSPTAEEQGKNKSDPVLFPLLRLTIGALGKTCDDHAGKKSTSTATLPDDANLVESVGPRFFDFDAIVKMYEKTVVTRFLLVNILPQKAWQPATLPTWPSDAPRWVQHMLLLGGVSVTTRIAQTWILMQNHPTPPERTEDVVAYTEWGCCGLWCRTGKLLVPATATPATKQAQQRDAHVWTLTDPGRELVHQVTEGLVHGLMDTVADLLTSSSSPFTGHLLIIMDVIRRQCLSVAMGTQLLIAFVSMNASAGMTSDLTSRRFQAVIRVIEWLQLRQWRSLTGEVGTDPDPTRSLTIRRRQWILDVATQLPFVTSSVAMLLMPDDVSTRHHHIGMIPLACWGTVIRCWQAPPPGRETTGDVIAAAVTATEGLTKEDMTDRRAVVDASEMCDVMFAHWGPLFVSSPIRRYVRSAGAEDDNAPSAHFFIPVVTSSVVAAAAIEFAKRLAHRTATWLVRTSGWKKIHGCVDQISQ